MFCPNCGTANRETAHFCVACGTTLQHNTMDYLQPVFMEYAGFWRRFGANFVDSIILAIAGGLLGGIVGGIIGAIMGASGVNLDTIRSTAMFFGYVIAIILNWLYFTLFESSAKQATPGKMALGIIVTDLNGNPISFGKANGRYWGKIISTLILLIGYIMAAFTEKKQALHDMMAGTLVIKK